MSEVTPKNFTLALVGNPNTGKTTLFNALTGLNQRTGNFPGCTVNKVTGRFNAGPHRVDVVDLPGTYSLASISPDEQVVEDVLLNLQEGTEVDGVLVVADACCLHRNLYLITQLMELGLPMVMALNMSDLAQAKGLKIDHAKLEQSLGFPIVATSAKTHSGFDQLKDAVAAIANGNGQTPQFSLFEDLHKTAGSLADELESNAEKRKPLAHQLFRALIDESGFTEKRLRVTYGDAFQKGFERTRQTLTAQYGKLIEYEAETRYRWIGELTESAVTPAADSSPSLSERFDAILTHRVFGMAFLFVLLTVLFQTIYTWAGPLMDAIEGGVGAIGSVIGSGMQEGMLKSLLVDGIIAGVGGVLVFLPQIVLLFLFIAVLEDCGYMARAAFLMDRVFNKCGLSGKSLIPMLSGFACAVPALMATRSIEDQRDRFATIMVTPLMSCSARLPVYVILIAAFIPEKNIFGIVGLQGLTLLSMYLIGIVIAIPAAFILKKTLLAGQSPPFLMELPSYKWPAARTVATRVYQSAKNFTIRAGTVILAVSILIWAMAWFPRSQEITQDFAAKRKALQTQFQTDLAALTGLNPSQLAGVQTPEQLQQKVPQPVAQAVVLVNTHADNLSALDSQQAGAYLRHSYLGKMGQAVQPVVSPLGWDWRIGMAAIASFPAREVVIAALGIIYNLGADQDETSVELQNAMQMAVWPDGRRVFNVPVALSLMIFFALCAQCAATLATIKQETGETRWAVLSFVFMTSAAYVGAFATYHITTALGWG